MRGNSSFEIKRSKKRLGLAEISGLWFLGELMEARKWVTEELREFTHIHESL